MNKAFKKKIFNAFHLSIFLLLTGMANAQITTGESLPSSNAIENNFDQNIYHIEVPSNISALKGEFSSKSEAWKFGEALPLDLNLKNAGDWSTIDAKNSKWHLHIKAEKAISINLNFSDFYLSENAKLFIYSKDQKDVLGAITQSNNKVDGQFSTRPIFGEEIHVELWVPTIEIEENRLQLHQLVYGYRDFRLKANKTFNRSAICNQNIGCPEGILWSDLKRSVVMITTVNNTRLCTGTLVNNVAQDSTPYLLTASHCNVATNSNFIFNYESPNPKCDFSSDTSNGPLNQSISGATSRARGVSPNPSVDFTDFHLFELSSTPPASYNAYYAGWSAVDTVTTRATTIHHPSGDIKKISIDEDTTISTGNNTLMANTHWMVADWELGTTQSGSSGSALFDENLRIIGQLQGGDAACNNNAQDYYGKFAISWDSLSANNRQLKHWLDPNNTGVLVLDGMDPNGINIRRDVQLLPIRGIPRLACDTAFTPRFAIRNNGSDTITSLKGTLFLNGSQLDTFVWNGSLASKKVTEFSGKTYTISEGFYRIYASVTINNGMLDQDSSNNNSQTEFLASEQNKRLNLRIKTDDFGLETSWELEMDDSNKVILYKGGPYNEVSGGETFFRKMCVPDSSCFNFILYDAFNDGFNGGFGNGNVLITDVLGDTILFENNFTGSKKTIRFCSTNASTSIEEISKSHQKIFMFPNPVRRGELLNFRGNDKIVNIQLFDINGRFIMNGDSQSFIVPTDMSPGIYFIRYLDDVQGSEIEKLMVH